MTKLSLTDREVLNRQPTRELRAMLEDLRSGEAGLSKAQTKAWVQAINARLRVNRSKGRRQRAYTRRRRRT